MIEPASFYESLRRHGFSFFSGVPDSLLKDLCAYITGEIPTSDHVINANEGSAVALAAGYHLATGRTPVVYLQNSGIGNTINPLLSLADPAVYGIPMLLLIGWRGEPGIKDEPQHVTQGRVMEKLLAAIEVPHHVIGPDDTDVDALLREITGAMRVDPRPHAILIRWGTFAAYSPSPTDARVLPLTRARAIELVLDRLPLDALVVSTTGMASREVFSYRERHGEGHERDFLTVGSMGHCSQIALGIAKHRPERTVICLDGDGAVIMHMGSLAVIGTQGPPNLRHIVINNGAHDSVGGQPTAGLSIKLSQIAAACGYRDARVATREDELLTDLAELMVAAGPSLLEIQVASDAHTDAGRPTSTPAENKAALMTALAADGA